VEPITLSLTRLLVQSKRPVRLAVWIGSGEASCVAWRRRATAFSGDDIRPGGIASSDLGGGRQGARLVSLPSSHRQRARRDTMMNAMRTTPSSFVGVFRRAVSRPRWPTERSPKRVAGEDRRMVSEGLAAEAFEPAGGRARAVSSCGREARQRRCKGSATRPMPIAEAGDLDVESWQDRSRHPGARDVEVRARLGRVFSGWARQASSSPGQAARDGRLHRRGVRRGGLGYAEIDPAL